MNKLTKQLLEEAGYNYPDLAVLAQTLVDIVAGKCAAIAGANGHSETASQIINTFTAPDPQE